MREAEKHLETLPYWDKLNEEEKQSVIRAAVIQNYNKGKMLHCGGMECLGMIMVLKGSVRVFIISDEGREITLFRLKEGEPCVMSASCVISQISFDTQMEAECETRLLIINSGIYGALTDTNINVRCFTFELIAKRFSSVMWTMQEIMFKGFDRRLASFLVSEYNSDNGGEVYMTHELIAQRLNSAREVVARMLKRFSEDGYIETRRGAVKIVDIAALRDLAK